MSARNAHPENVPGDFYVEDQCCTMCSIPFTEAPALFGTTTDESHCFVKKQPYTEVELGQMVNAIQCAELNCIRYGGSNRTIQVRLVQNAAGSICDALPQDLQELSANMERQALHRWPARVENGRINQSWWRQLLRFFRRGAPPPSRIPAFGRHLTSNVGSRKYNMESFGVNFRIDRPELYEPLVAVFEALKQAKIAQDFGEIEAWSSKFVEHARIGFHWPTREEQEESSALRSNHPVLITQPEDALGQAWDFGSFLDAIENGEYSLLEIAKTSDSSAELRIDPEAYPYGGIGAFIALVEVHGMYVLGVNEYGKYQPRGELTSETIPRSKKPWWKCWQ